MKFLKQTIYLEGEPHSQRIGGEIDLERGNQFRGGSAPSRMLGSEQPGGCLYNGIWRFLPQFCLSAFQVPN
jgi:hypothetical protein